VYVDYPQRHTMSLYVQQNATSHIFEDIRNRKLVYLGVHALMDKYMFNGASMLELIHTAASNFRQGPHYQRRPGHRRSRMSSPTEEKTGKERGEEIHEKVAMYIENKRWSEKYLKDDANLMALYTLLNESGLTVWRGNLTVADEKLLVATGNDLVCQDENREIIACELKCVQGDWTLDFTLPSFPHFQPPFDMLPFTAGFLAEVQAEIGRRLLMASCPGKKDRIGLALVLVIDCETHKAFRRTVSPTAQLAATAILELHAQMVNIQHPSLVGTAFRLGCTPVKDAADEARRRMIELARTHKERLAHSFFPFVLLDLILPSIERKLTRLVFSYFCTP
jgi:hypothetical protein